MSESFIKLLRSKNAETLAIKDPYAFSILTVIVQRARRTSDGINFNNLRIGDALIGRKEFSKGRHSMSETNFRSALKRLVKYNLVTTKPTNKGTIVSLCNKDIYDINVKQTDHQHDQQLTSNQPATSQQPTTNKNVKNVKNGKNGKKGPPTTLPPLLNPDSIVSVRLNAHPQNMSIGEAVDRIFKWYGSPAKSNDRELLSRFISENPEYPIGAALKIEKQRAKVGGYTQRGYRSIVTEPLDRWYVEQQIKGTEE